MATWLKERNFNTRQSNTLSTLDDPGTPHFTRASAASFAKQWYNHLQMSDKSTYCIPPKTYRPCINYEWPKSVNADAGCVSWKSTFRIHVDVEQVKLVEWQPPFAWRRVVTLLECTDENTDATHRGNRWWIDEPCWSWARKVGNVQIGHVRDVLLWIRGDLKCDQK